LQTRNWTDANGQKRYATEVLIDEANFVDSKSESHNASFSAPDTYGAPSYSTADTTGSSFEEATGEDDLPF
jgi:single-strand DNA-binding protein